MPSYTTIGRVSLFSLLTANTIRNINKEEGDYLSDAWDITKWGIGTIFIFSPGTDTKIVGWGVANAWRLGAVIVRSPYAQAAYVPYIAGLAASEVIDPVSGLDNYIGFTSGGKFGEEDIHYFSGDPNDSGYFNIGRNVQIIGTHYYNKTVTGYKNRGEQVKQTASDMKKYIEHRKQELLQRPSWV